MIYIAEKEGREEAGKSYYRKLPKYKSSRAERKADTGTDFVFIGHPGQWMGWRSRMLWRG